MTIKVGQLEKPNPIRKRRHNLNRNIESKEILFFLLFLLWRRKKGNTEERQKRRKEGGIKKKKKKLGENWRERNDRYLVHLWGKTNKIRLFFFSGWITLFSGAHAKKF